MMVDGVRLSGTGPVERVGRVAALPVGLRGIPVSSTGPSSFERSSTIAALAAQGAPVDASRVAAVRAAIADGSYTIDADAIAARVVEIDLPLR